MTRLAVKPVTITLALFSAATSHAASAPLTDSVLPLVGTGGVPYVGGMTSPAVSRPWGLVRVGPDTRFSGPLALLNKARLATSGYLYGHDELRGFSQLRLSGTGAFEGGEFRILPHSPIRTLKQRRDAVPFSHDNEEAHPGVYRLYLESESILAEVTATEHCALHRYTSNRDFDLLLDAASVLDPDQEKTPPQAQLAFTHGDGSSIEGSVTTEQTFSARTGGLTTYFTATVSPAPKRASLWHETQEVSVDRMASGTDVGAWLRFSKGPVTVRICVSHTRIENARASFSAEADGKSFDQVASDATQAWENALSRIQIDTRTAAQKSRFYTALYHSLLMPTQFTELNGEYLGFGHQLAQASDFHYRTDLSLWDTFRTTHPLYNLIAPETQRDSLKSLLAMARVQGGFPLWPSGAGDGASMFGSPANFLFSETFKKRPELLSTSEWNEALTLMRRSTLNPAPGVAGREPICFATGFCPSDQVGDSVSKTLEYAWADFATARLAESLGDHATQIEFDAYAKRFRSVWDPETRYFRPKNAVGTFQPLYPGLLSFIFPKQAEAYTEGSAKQWRFSVPHDPEALITLFGGSAAFTEELTAFMEGASPLGSAINPGPNYWQGNEHDLHALFLFNEAGHPELTQQWSRWALRTRYGIGPGGIPGNDDAGALSSWYVLSALGLYPQAGTENYWLGSPEVEHAWLELGQGHRLEIRAYGQKAHRDYVKRVFLNGHRICGPTLQHSDLVDGLLEFWMSDDPAPQGGYDCQN